MEATELRKKKTELENKIGMLVFNFINEVGYCEIRINVESASYNFSSGETVKINNKIKVEVTV